MCDLYHADHFWFLNLHNLLCLLCQVGWDSELTSPGSLLWRGWSGWRRRSHWHWRWTAQSRIHQASAEGTPSPHVSSCTFHFGRQVHGCWRKRPGTSPSVPCTVMIYWIFRFFTRAARCVWSVFIVNKDVDKSVSYFFRHLEGNQWKMSSCWR